LFPVNALFGNYLCRLFLKVARNIFGLAWMAWWWQRGEQLSIESMRTNIFLCQVGTFKQTLDFCHLFALSRQIAALTISLFKSIIVSYVD
jgi:hypothetical protein